MTGANADLALDARTADGPSTYRFRTADGVHSPDAFRDGALLALERLWDRDLGDLLCVAANYGVVGVVLAARAETVTMTESSARAAALCERNARRNDAAADVELVTHRLAPDGRFDTAVYVPKPYTALAVGKQRIADALASLSPGGELFLAADRGSGLARYTDWIDELVGGHESVGSRDGHRLIRARRPDAFDAPTVVEARTRSVSAGDVSFDVVTRPGLFSASGLDDGTRLLCEAAAVSDGERVLDLCCGYGPVGTYAALAADCDVWLSDDDRVATACAERTLAANGVDGTVVTADCVDGVRDCTFDRVLCNPPTHAGGEVLRQLFAGAADVLAAGGECRVVHHRALELDRALGAFESVETIASGEEHVVVRAAL